MENSHEREPKIAWYSISQDLEVETHEPVSYDRAVEIIDGYLARGMEAYKGGEEAIAATAFGFSCSESEFIEICVNGPSEFAFSAESPEETWLGKLLRGIAHRDEVLHSREELLARVNDFFLHHKSR